MVSLRTSSTPIYLSQVRGKVSGIYGAPTTGPGLSCVFYAMLHSIILPSRKPSKVDFLVLVSQMKVRLGELAASSDSSKWKRAKSEFDLCQSVL